MLGNPLLQNRITALLLLLCQANGTLKKFQKIQKSQKILKNPFFCFFLCWTFFFSPKKKCYPLNFPIIGGCNSTRALQSSPFQNPPGGVPWAWRRRRPEGILVSNLGWCNDLRTIHEWIKESEIGGNHLSSLIESYFFSWEGIKGIYQLQKPFFNPCAGI